MRTQGQPAVQGDNAQAAVAEGQIIVAAEVTVDSPDLRAPAADDPRHPARSPPGGDL